LIRDCTAIERSTLLREVDGPLSPNGMKIVWFPAAALEFTLHTAVFAESDDGDVSCAYIGVKLGDNHWTLNANSVPLNVEETTFAYVEKGRSWAGKLSFVHAR